MLSSPMTWELWGPGWAEVSKDVLLLSCSGGGSVLVSLVWGWLDSAVCGMLAENLAFPEACSSCSMGDPVHPMATGGVRCGSVCWCGPTSLARSASYNCGTSTHLCCPRMTVPGTTLRCCWRCTNLVHCSKCSDSLWVLMSGCTSVWSGS